MINPGRFQPPSTQVVVYGQSMATQLPEVMGDFWASNAVLVTNTTLSEAGGLADKVKEVLGDGCHSFIPGIRANTPREDVIKIAGTLRSRGIEAVISLGGSSVVDAVKTARICLTNNVGTPDDMDRLKLATTAASPRPYLISIPTTLSGGDYTPRASALDSRSGRKDTFFHKDLAPDAVILDPAMTLHTPEQLWLSSGIRALDHAIEGWLAKNAAPYSDACAVHAVRLLSYSLPRTKGDTTDLDARLHGQVGSWMAIQGAAIGVHYGASHGIGDALNVVANISHGLASCVMLPHVLRYNAVVNADRQKILAEAMGDPSVPLSDMVASLVSSLGLPSRLRDLEVDKAHFPRIAELALEHPRIGTNPRPITDVTQIGELLEAAW